MKSNGNHKYELSEKELAAFFEQKYGAVESAGRSPKVRHNFNYFLPGEIYEATVDKLVFPGISWIDIGGGSAIFPRNLGLVESVASRAARLVAVDPSANVTENSHATEVAQCMFEDYESDQLFNLATFSMVAEHIAEPAEVVRKLSSILEPGGVVVVHTVNKNSPIPVVARLTPFALHFQVKKLIWGGEEKDTFPVVYKMNTRKALADLFAAEGLVEDFFLYLDDLSVTINFPVAHRLENYARKGFNRFGLRYPETNLLGIYRKPE